MLVATLIFILKPIKAERKTIMCSINFDFDGTLYEWDPTRSLEEVGNPIYPAQKQRHVWPMLYAAEKLNNDFPGVIRIASAVLNDGCMRAKISRISTDIGSDVANRSIFTVFGEDKITKMNVKGNKRIGIKVYNGINGNNGTWKGYSVHSTADPETCYKQLKAIIYTIISEDKDVDILIDDFSENLRAWERQVA